MDDPLVIATEDACRAGTVVPVRGTFRVKSNETEGSVAVFRTYDVISESSLKELAGNMGDVPPDRS